MSQPERVNQQQSDPLLDFSEEHQATERVDPVERVEPVEPPQVSSKEPDPPSAEDLRARVASAERLIDRALIEITSLKSEMATLVNAVDDIKRMSRPLEKLGSNAAMRSRKPPAHPAIAAVVVVLIAGAAALGIASLGPDQLREPAPVGRETSTAAPPAPAIVEPQPEVPVVVQAATRTSPPPPPVAPAARPGSASGSRLRQGQGEQAGATAAKRPPPVTYVGMLTIDAEPPGDVYLNRQSVGRTPVRLDNLRAGSHLIWIEREGYRRWTRVVAVAADRVSRVSASLDPLSR